MFFKSNFKCSANGHPQNLIKCYRVIDLQIFHPNASILSPRMLDLFFKFELKLTRKANKSNFYFPLIFSSKYFHKTENIIPCIPFAIILVFKPLPNKPATPSSLIMFLTVST
jgi:hypothetical protein